MTSKRYEPTTQSRAVELFKKGWSIARITREPDMPTQGKTVRRWLRDEGQPLRGNPPHYDRRAILRELDKGKSRTEICDTYGCSSKYISRLLRAEGREDLGEGGSVVKKKSTKKKSTKKKATKKKSTKKKATKKKATKKKTPKKKAPKKMKKAPKKRGSKKKSRKKTRTKRG